MTITRPTREAVKAPPPIRLANATRPTVASTSRGSRKGYLPKKLRMSGDSDRSSSISMAALMEPTVYPPQDLDMT